MQVVLPTKSAQDLHNGLGETIKDYLILWL